MKVKIQTTFPKVTYEVDNVYFSSDLHLGHQAVIDYGRSFKSLEEMNYKIISSINEIVGYNDILVLLGDTMMGEKNYERFLDALVCKNIILLYGNHCNIGKIEAVEEKLLYHGHYVELLVDKQYICCQHYPSFHWNHQEDGSLSLHGHLHADESAIVKEIHKYKSLDVGVDNYFKLYGKYRPFSFTEVVRILKNNKTIERH